MKTLINFLILLIISISIFLFIYVYNYSHEIFKGEQFEYFKNFYFISIALFFVSLAVFFSKNSIKIYFLIIIFSVFFSIYSFETFLIYQEKTNEVNKIKYYKKVYNKDFDTRSKHEIYDELKKTNDNITVFVPSLNIRQDNKNFVTLSGISNHKTILCNESGYYSLYESDRYGFNNPDEEWDKEEIEYFILGDSFTLGACVNRPYDISSNLRILSKKSVINLGYGGNGPLKEFAGLKEYILPNVKKVLWLYYEGNDLRNLATEQNNDLLNKYIEDSNFTQDLISNQKILDNYKFQTVKKEMQNASFNQKERFNKLKEFIKLTKLRKKFYKIDNTIHPSQTQLKNILKKAKEFTSLKNIEFYFVYLPEFSRFVTNYDKTNYYEVKKIITTLDIPFIDINELVFDKQNNKLEMFPFQKFGHYNLEGYRYVAEAIYNYTKEN